MSNELIGIKANQLIAINLRDGYHEHVVRYFEGNYSVRVCYYENCLHEYADKIK